jgi:hypothetical protein
MKLTILSLILGLATLMTSMQAHAKTTSDDVIQEDLDQVTAIIGAYNAGQTTKSKVDTTIQKWLQDSGQDPKLYSSNSLTDSQIKDLHPVKLANINYLVTDIDGKCLVVPAKQGNGSAAGDACSGQKGSVADAMKNTPIPTVNSLAGNSNSVN